MLERLKWWTTDESDEQPESQPQFEEMMENIEESWDMELLGSNWQFCAVMIDPGADAEVYNESHPFPSQQIVIEQNELGEYRTRPLLDVIGEA